MVHIKILYKKELAVVYLNIIMKMIFKLACFFSFNSEHNDKFYTENVEHIVTLLRYFYIMP